MCKTFSVISGNQNKVGIEQSCGNPSIIQTYVQVEIELEQISHSHSVILALLHLPRKFQNTFFGCTCPT